jgi:hypothetical protein
MCILDMAIQIQKEQTGMKMCKYLLKINVISS